MNRTLLLILITLLGLAGLAAQTVTNIRAKQDPELGYWTISFDLSGNATDTYLIKLTPYKSGKEISSMKSLSGMTTVNPGKNLTLYWNPFLEGIEKDGWQFRIVADKATMVFVQGGSFMMGSKDGNSDEKPVHQVTVSSFYIGKYEVTQKEWSAVMGTSPSKWKGDNLPVEQVSWYEAIDYCNKRSIREGLNSCYSINGNTKPTSWSSGTIVCDWNANGYRLPTEVEWEYAARGGNKSKGYKYSGSNDIGTVAWYDGNSSSKSRSVGGRNANELGLHDMSGNVWEWCWDLYDSGYYGRSPARDPRGTNSGSSRLLRGGSWYRSGVSNCRVAIRGFNHPFYQDNNVGFRILRA
ncbi:MAG: formylglycine-generating enzyme family protein, partial [Candidatus Cloacimonadaceae bacterium]|nr:formylglycine-generating enzyme family protein [Candidatus Cloacimonadaceae bacterium]